MAKYVDRYQIDILLAYAGQKTNIWNAQFIAILWLFKWTPCRIIV